MTFGKRAGAIAAVVTGATLVPLVAFGGVGLAAKNAPSGSQYEYPGANQYKVTICHHTHSKKHPFHTITVSANAVAKHLKKHGDTLGACPTTPPATTPAAPTHGNDNGKNKEHGNNGHHGKP